MDSLLSTATSFLGSKSHSSSAPAQSPAHGEKPSPDAENPSYGDAFASAQVLMGAAKSKMSPGQQGGDGGALDMGELAGAGANLIGTASHYGKMDNTSYGAYAQKAETYLHDYQTKHGKPSHGHAEADPSPHQGPKSSHGYSEEEDSPIPHQGRKPSQDYSEEEDYSKPNQGPRRGTSHENERTDEFDGDE